MTAAADEAFRFEDALAQAGVTGKEVSREDREAFARDGYVILRHALPEDQLEPLRDLFERQILPNDQWPFPRERGTRFAMIWDDPLVRRACLLPPLLAATHHMVQRRFYFSTVQGRDPLRGGGGQPLHRDWLEDGQPTMSISGFIFLDDFDAENGATRVVPGTHLTSETPALGHDPREIVVEGKACDVFLLDSHLIHSGTPNVSGRKRRSLHLGYAAQGVSDWLSAKRSRAGLSALERYLMGME